MEGSSCHSSSNSLNAPSSTTTTTTNDHYAKLEDSKLVALVQEGKLPAYKLEQALGATERAVKIRRAAIGIEGERIPFRSNHADQLFFNYEGIHGRCCENVIGFVPIPLGYAGPLCVDGVERIIPMATTEGALVASVHRGCKAINLAGGTSTVVIDDGMTRAPCLRLPTVQEAAKLKAWVQKHEKSSIKDTFNATSRFARLQQVKTLIAGNLVFLRFKATTGDAMGMNMLSKGTEAVLNELLKPNFPDLVIVSLSGNACSDKKSSALNWIEGRGKSVISECTLPASIVAKVLRTSVPELVSLSLSKNLVGSIVSGSAAGSGCNAHAANIVSAIFIATGQDPAQVVESSSCMTLLELDENNDLHVTCTMPCIEVGTLGGGTELDAQAGCLDLMGGLAGASENVPATNAKILASSICSAVMAGELSLMASLSAGTLVSSHLSLNRKQQ